MKKNRGFTLMELMIVVAILGILTSIVYPSYSEHVLKAKRAEAQAALMSFATAMEQWKIQNGTGGYKGAAASNGDTGSPTVFSTVVPVSGGTTTYNLTISAASKTDYTLTATPVSPQDTDSCGTLTLNSIGAKTPTTTGCW